MLALGAEVVSMLVIVLAMKELCPDEAALGVWAHVTLESSGRRDAHDLLDEVQ